MTQTANFTAAGFAAASQGLNVNTVLRPRDATNNAGPPIRFCMATFFIDNMRSFWFILDSSLDILETQIPAVKVRKLAAA